MEQFELVGKVLEKVGTKRKDGSRIDGLWKFTIETPQGEIFVSCDETYPYDGQRLPSPAFGALNQAAAEGLNVWVAGVLKDGKYRNARKAELREGPPAEVKAQIDAAIRSDQPAKDPGDWANSEPPEDPWDQPPAETLQDALRGSQKAQIATEQARPAESLEPSRLEILVAMNLALLRMPADRRTGEATPEFLAELAKTTRGALGLSRQILK